MKCPFCGAENDEVAEFCSLCYKPFQHGESTSEQLSVKSSIPSDYSDPNRYINDFMPPWRQFVVFNICSWIIAWGYVVWFFLLFTGQREPIHIVILMLLVVIPVVPYYYLVDKLRCPNCSCNVYWLGYWKTYVLFWQRPWYQFLLNGNCPNCGVKLRNRFW